MLLSDQGLTRSLAIEELVIHPWTKGMIQPASIDLQLGDVDTDPLLGRPMEERIWRIEAGQFVLAATYQTVQFPNHLAGRVEGKSTWGRRGLLVHAAGFVDPGFTGQLTLELKNLSHKPILLHEKVFICQLAVWKLDTHAVRAYGDPHLGSHYQGQMGVTHAWTE